MKSCKDGKKPVLLGPNEKVDNLLSIKHTWVPIGPESYPNSGGATSVKAGFPWECECEVGGMDLGPLFYNFELIWKSSIPAYRDDPKGGLQPDLDKCSKVY